MRELLTMESKVSPVPTGPSASARGDCSEPLWEPRWKHLCLEGGRLWAWRAAGDLVTLALRGREKEVPSGVAPASWERVRGVWGLSSVALR